MATLLIIDDDAQIIVLLRRILKKAGHRALEATDAEAGIQIYKDSKPDLVIVDIIMPDKDGLETISEIRNLSPDVKIIAISGGGKATPAEYLRMAKAFGADCAIEKPIDKQELLSVVSRLLPQS